MTKFDLWSRYVAKTKRPILVGPWWEEIGSETLYWIPFVAQWAKKYGIARDRLFPISRAGASIWYHTPHPIELDDYWPPEARRIEALKAATNRGSVKQTVVTELERTLYPTIATRLGLRRYHVLHPKELYSAIAGWTSETMGLADVMQHLRFEPLPTPHLPLHLNLPQQYVCVRFYARHTWPLTEEVKDWCGSVVSEIAKRVPVVVIGNSAHSDDHLDLNFTGPNITSLMDAFPQRENLALQSAVMAKSSLFVGTYGGTMQLAVRLGKPSAGFYLQWSGTAWAHKNLTEWLAVQQHLPIFIGTPQQGEMLRSVINTSLELPQPVGSSS